MENFSGESLEQKAVRLEEELKKKDEIIESLRKEIGEVKQNANFDKLTGLARRDFFKQEIEKYFPNTNGLSNLETNNQRKKIEMPPFSLIFFDIDHFKNVNDTYGHEVGDIVLERVAKIITEGIRDDDLTVRWGGEEMLVAMIGADEEIAVAKANFIREEISKIDFSDIPNLPKALKVTISAGVAHSLEFNGFKKLCDAADKAMYESKRAGRNRVTAHSARPTENSEEVLVNN